MPKDYRPTFKDLNFSLPEKPPTEKPPTEKPPVVDRTNCTKCKKCKQVGVKAYPNADHWGRCIDCNNEARSPINWIVALKNFGRWIAMAVCSYVFYVLLAGVCTIALMAAWLLMWWPLWLFVWLAGPQK